MSFAFIRVLEAKSRRIFLFNALAFGLMFAGAMATQRKTALLAVIAVVLYVGFHRRRQFLRVAPAGLVLATVLIHFAAPGSLGTILDVEAALGSNSTSHRAGDFTNLAPDVGARPLLGRGYGSLDQAKSDQFRINDNQFLDVTWEVGIGGLLAYMWMILSPVVAARRAIRSRDPTQSSLALAAAGGCVAFFAVSALFDALAFPQAAYLFVLIAALSTVASSGPAGTVPTDTSAIARWHRGSAAVPA
jgi:O-antigen ligase